jgi:hypothetical protein
MPHIDVILTVGCSELDDGKLVDMARAMTRSLRDEGLDAAAVQAADGLPGMKGDPITLGAIALSLIGSGGVAVTLLQVLKAYVERKSTLRFEITHPDGRKVSLDAGFFEKAQLEQTRKILTDLLKR